MTEIQNKPHFLPDELPFWSAAFGLKLLNVLDYKAGITVLDLGCGSGFPLFELASRFGPGAKIIGLDPNAKALNRCREKINFYKTSNVELICAGGENIPLPDKSVDLITSNNGINNVSDRRLTFKECRRILKKGGQFVYSYNLNGTMAEFYQVFTEILNEKGLHDSLLAVQQHIANKRPGLGEMIRITEETGFSLKEIYKEHFCYHFASGTAMFNHFMIRNAFLNIWKSLVPENRCAEVFQNIEEKLNIFTAKNRVFSLTIPFAVIDCKG